MITRRGFLELLGLAAAAFVAEKHLPKLPDRAPDAESEQNGLQYDGLFFFEDPMPMRGYIDDLGRFQIVEPFLLAVTALGEVTKMNPAYKSAPLEVSIYAKAEKIDEYLLKVQERQNVQFA